MSKPQKKPLVPALRFPEFQDKGEWIVKPLEKVCDVHNNRRQPISSNNREKGIYPYYGASGIVDYVKDYIFDERLLLVGEDGAKWGAFEKTAFIAEGKYWVNNHAHVLKPTEVINTLLENYLVKLDISQYVTGAAPPKLTLGKLKEIPIVFPLSSGEQQKIADCLASIDDLITAETQKLATLKTHKKGLMQQLFPAEGETVPRLRFPEFRDAGEWQVKPLNDVAKITSGGTPNRSEPNYWGDSIPWVTTSLINFNIIDNAEEFITTDGLKNSSAKLFPAKTLLMAMYGQGKTRGKVALLGIESTTNQACAAIIFDKEINTNCNYSVYPKTALRDSNGFRS